MKTIGHLTAEEKSPMNLTPQEIWHTSNLIPVPKHE